MRRLSPLAAILAAISALAGCGYEDSRTAHEAQISLVGLSSSDLQACAGVPDRAKTLPDGTEVLTYVLKNDASGGVDITLPIIGGGYTLGGSGSSCNANVRIADNRVRDVFYSGNNDRAIGTDGVCAPIMRGCLRRPQPGMTPITASNRGALSAYGQPPVTTPPGPFAENATPGSSTLR